MCLARNGVKIVSKSFSKEFYLHFLNQEKNIFKFDFLVLKKNTLLIFLQMVITKTITITI